MIILCMDMKLLIGVMLIVIIGVSLVYGTIESVVTDSTTLTTQSLENVTFTANNTNSVLDHTPSAFTGLYYFNNATFPIPASRYVQSGTNIKVLANNTGFLAGTGAYPNVTNTTSGYYASYAYEGDGYISGASSTILNLLPFLIIVVMIVVIITMLGFL